MRRIFPEMNFSAVITVGLVLLFGFAQIASAQAPTPLPLSLDNNYMVTGDYVVGGWTKTSSTTINGTLMSTGTVPVPDSAAYATSVPLQKVPAGADIVAAFLYWQTVEISGENAGENGFFNNGNGSNYPISGTVLGNLNAPVSWSSGGCAGSAKGTKTIVTYRADVGDLLPVDANGNIQPNTTYQVSLPDSGKPGTPPFTEGATLVIVYRLLVPTVPLNAVIIYDGSFAPSNSAQTMTQPMLGFFQAGNDQSAPIATKITHIAGNGQANKLQQVYLNNYDAHGNLVHSTSLPSLYGTNPPFPGNYNGSWDNPTWFPNTYATTPAGDSAVQAGESSETTVVVPNSSNKGCVSWGAIVMSTTVQDSNLDGLPDVSKTNQGYCDPRANPGRSNQGTCPLGTSDPSWVSLAGASRNNQDIFIQLDYMCSKVIINNASGPPNTGTCDPSGVSYKPDPAAVSNLVSAFASNGHNINVHVIPDDNHVILAQTCPDNTAASPPVYCPYPGQAGMVGWEAGFEFLKTQPLNYPDETSCETQTPPGGMAGSGPVCVRRFPYGQNNSYHEVIFGVGVGTPNWSFLDGSLTSEPACPGTPPAPCVVWSGNTVTFTTSAAHGLVAAISNTDTNPNARVTVSGAISNPSLNNTYLVSKIGVDSVGNPCSTCFTIQVATSTTSPVAYTSTTDPVLAVHNGVAGTRSGASDLGGANSLITLGLWGADGQTVPVESGTFMHELGHSLALTHGGLFRTPVAGGGYSFSFDPNCKSNFQSVMNYMFQVVLLDGVLDYSEQVLNTLNENGPLPPSVLASAIHPTTYWYAPNQTVGSPATAHCDGTPLLPTDQPMFRLKGPVTSIPWPVPLPQDINFDGTIETSLQGYDDWDNIDPRQIGASGNDSWAGGAPGSRVLGAPGSRVLGAPGSRVLGAPGSRILGKDIDFKTASNTVPPPTDAVAALTPSNTVQVSFTPPAFPQSLMDHFNVYRKTNDGPFTKSAYGSVSVAGMPLPLPNRLTFTDSNVGCATYSYFVTTVFSDGRESVPSNTAGPITVPCMFNGFLSPLSTASKAPAPPTFSGSRNLGNALPIKWELVDASGNPVGDLTTLKLMQACPTTGSTVPPASSTIPPCVLIFSPTTGGEGSTTFRYSAPNFIINWDTGSLSGLAPGFWTIELELSDGRTYWTNVQF